MTERVLPFDRTIVRQDTSFWCGPASAQVVLSSRGISVDEATLARECGTTRNGTDNVGKIERVLDVRIPEARYFSVYPGGTQIGSPARPADVRRDYFWWDIVRSIDNGFPVILNWVVAPFRKPIQGVKGSPNPSYGGGATYHYVTCVGWSDEGRDGKQSLLIADSGFSPYVYWVDFETAFQLIHTDAYKGYALANQPLIDPPPPGVVLPPGIPIREGAVPPPVQPPLPPTPAPVPVVTRLADPRTVTDINGNSYRPRNHSIEWIGVHTSESNSRVRDLNAYCKTHDVSYNRFTDDRDILVAVEDGNAPWSAVNANRWGLHMVFSTSFAGWSREAWLDESTGNDGINERQALRNGAKIVAFWCQEHNIPAQWIGGGARPPYGQRGICGHVDFGAWGGGHTDPGVNFPVNTFLGDVREELTGVPAPVIAPAPPVSVPGTNPQAYADWLLYQGNPRNDPGRVAAAQRKLHRYSYGQVIVDGDFGPATRAAIMQFQRNSRLVADGIVGPMTAAALFA